MSVTINTKIELEGVIGPMEDFEKSLRDKLTRAREFVRKGEALLETLGGKTPREGDTPANPDRYKGMLPEPAMLMFFNSERGRAVTKEELIDELVSGNVKAGSAKQTIEQKRGNVKRSIYAQTKAGGIRQVKDKYGHPDWPDEKFKVP